MTLPTIVPTGFAATSKDFLKAKVMKDGSAFLNRAVVTVPASTVVATVVGLVPVKAGAALSVPSLSVLFPALGASVTASLGIIYDDTTNNTSNATLYASASTTAAAGGVLSITATAANQQYVVTGDGWLAVTLGGATTTASALDINAQVLVDYFSGGIQA